MAEVFFMAAVDGIGSKEKEYAQKQFSLVTSQGRKISEAIGNAKFKLICATDIDSKKTARVLADFIANSLQESKDDISTVVLPLEDIRLDSVDLNFADLVLKHKNDETNTVFVITLSNLRIFVSLGSKSNIV
jgi:hypothetical protein